MKYRADIDGLRAFAVLVVVWFHAGLGGAGGGYTGVDVFFVISGYLIGGIIIEETSAGRFSYLDFYARRAKRLFAAFFVVALATVATGWWLLLPGDLREAGKTLVAATVALSNWVFHGQSGYFAGDAVTKPFLHTWSLAVEEQFYLLFPIVMVAALRLGLRAVPAILGVIAAGSLIAAEIMLRTDPSFSFYLLPTRAWELLLGTLVALPQVRRIAIPPRLQAALTIAAVSALCLPVVLYSEETAFPGLAAVPSCAGTAWLLWAGGQNPGSMVSRVLALRPLVFTGRISYSLYLWHWPVIVYITYLQSGVLSTGGGIAAIAASFALATLSWRFVEQPARQTRRSPLVILGAAAAGAAILVIVGLLLWRNDGAPSRLSPETRIVAEAAGDFMQWREDCESEDNRTYPGIGYCSAGVRNQPPRFVVWGDSHARTLRDGIDQLAAEVGTGGPIFWAGGCMPTIDLQKRESAASPKADLACAAQNAAVQRYLQEQRGSGLRAVLLVGRWSYYTEGSGIGRDAHNTIRLEHSTALPAATTAHPDQPTIVAGALQRTTRWLREQGYDVYLLEQPPEIPDYSSRRLFQSMRTGHESREAAIARFGSIPRSEVERRQHNAGIALDGAAAGGVATVLRTRGLFCDEQLCSAERSSGPAYFDNNHLRSAMSREIRDVFRPVVERRGTTAP